jgi:hypothetical protein
VIVTITADMPAGQTGDGVVIVTETQTLGTTTAADGLASYVVAVSGIFSCFLLGLAYIICWLFGTGTE